MTQSVALDALSILFSLALPGPALAQVADGQQYAGGLGWLWWLGVAAMLLALTWLLFSSERHRAGAPHRPASRSGRRG